MYVSFASPEKYIWESLYLAKKSDLSSYFQLLQSRLDPRNEDLHLVNNNQEKWRNTSRVCVYQTDCVTPAAAGADESHQVAAAGRNSLGGRGGQPSP